MQPIGAEIAMRFGARIRRSGTQDERRGPGDGRPIVASIMMLRETLCAARPITDGVEGDGDSAAPVVVAAFLWSIIDGTARLWRARRPFALSAGGGNGPDANGRRVFLLQDKALCGGAGVGRR